MKIAIVFGTRPEVIKLYPVIKELKKKHDVKIVWTGQHDELASQMIMGFGIKVNFNLKVMIKNQSLSYLSIKLHQKLSELFDKERFDLVMVQGDTTSAMITALEAYYHKIPVAHVEAGLRTDNIYAPFPEEVNRRIITQIAKYNFTPTDQASVVCTYQGIGGVYQTGQTGIDTLLEIAKKIKTKKKKKLLITLHRRENFDKIGKILEKVITFLMYHPDWEAIYPVHPNPAVKKAISDANLPPLIKFVEPLSYFNMVREMKESSLILTDSGGIVEEVPSLKIPVLIAREITERPEAIEEGFARYLKDEIEIFEVPNKKNPFGDGKASKRIARFLR